MHAKNEIDEETRLELNVIQSDRSRNGEQRIGKYEKLIYWAYASLSNANDRLESRQLWDTQWHCKISIYTSTYPRFNVLKVLRWVEKLKRLYLVFKKPNTLCHNKKIGYENNRKYIQLNEAQAEEDFAEQIDRFGGAIN